MTPSDKTDASLPSVVVHLVHGTWPYGPFGKQSGKVKAWFEEGSPVRAALASSERCATDVRVFKWSGRNSVDARASAARDFLEHLRQSLNERADTRHVIVAHSHGGTVAAHALSMARIPPEGVPRIKALVCMATPFAYVERCSQETQMRTFFGLSDFFLAVLCVSLFAAGMLPQGPAALFLFLIGFVLKVLFSVLLDMCTPGLFLDRSYSGEPLPQRIPAFLIRATRDEAALVLAISQAAQYVTGKMHQILDETRLKLHAILLRGFMEVLLFVGICLPFLLIYFSGDLALPDVYLGFVLLTFVQNGARVLPAMAGRVIAAISVGDWKIARWPRTFIEVDPAPQDSACQFKSYSNIGASTSSLRHGIYEYETVQAEIRRIIEAVAAGNDPRMLYPDELYREARAAEVVASLTFVQKHDLCWVESPPTGPGIAIVDFNAPNPLEGITFNLRDSTCETQGRTPD